MILAGRGGGSASSEGEDEIGDGEGHSEKSAGMGADIEEGWQQVRDGAVALQKEASSAVVLQRRIYAKQV